MDVTLILEIVVVLITVYFLIKFIVSPVIKIVMGILIILVLIYLLQKFFGFNVDKVLSPFGISLNLSEWGQNFNFILDPINYYTDQAKNFLNSIWGNLPKSTKP